MALAPVSAPNDSSLDRLAAEAQALAARLPALRLEARRIAHTVAFGVHGRRRAGPGETFWQFRRFEQSDVRSQIDWRRSASSDRLFVREREWEAAHTVWLWADLTPSMAFTSHLASTSKRDRALLLLFAIAELLIEGGERVGLIGMMPPTAQRHASERIAERVLQELRAPSAISGPKALTEATLSRFSECVLIGDFLDPLEGTEAALRHLAGQGVRGQMVQVLDPAEETLDYSGRVEFLDPEGGHRWLAPRAETMRDAYKARLAAHRAGLDSMARRVRWSLLVHHTDRPAGEALLALYGRLSQEDRLTAQRREAAP